MRYKDASTAVKVWRWIRYGPEIPLRFAWDCFRWLIAGWPPIITQSPEHNYRRIVWYTRWTVWQHLWMIARSRAEYRMGRYVPLEELIAELKEKDQR